MQAAALATIRWWQARETWLKVLLAVLALPFLPALFIAAKKGDTQAGMGAAAIAALVGVVVVAVAGAGGDSTTDVDPVTAQEGPTSSESDEVAEPVAETIDPSPSGTTASEEAALASGVDISDALSADWGADVSRVAATDTDVTVRTAWQWEGDATSDHATDLCVAALAASNGRRVTVTDATGDVVLAEGTSTCTTIDRLAPSPAPAPPSPEAPPPPPSPEPEPTREPEPDPAPEPAPHYANCTEVREAGAAPIHRGDPGYGSHLDRDGDGIACE